MESLEKINAVRYVLGNKLFLIDPSIKIETYQNEWYHGIIFILENEGDGIFSRDARYDVVHHYHSNWERLIINNKSGIKDVPFHSGTYDMLPEGVRVTHMEEHNNKVELVGIYGSDESHALSAWTSTSRDLTDEKRGRMGKLLGMLGREGHHTPFEKSSIHFLVTTDIATHIHILKHRIGVSFNGESARYKELGKKKEGDKIVYDDKFYIPTDWDNDEQVRLVRFCENAFKEYHECMDRLVAKGVSRTRAKESARFYLPYSNQLTADVMFNFRSFMHFVGLRYSDHAQLEVKQVAYNMLNIVSQSGQFDLSLDAFGWTKEKIYG